jgi:hypothetical protein
MIRRRGRYRPPAGRSPLALVVVPAAAVTAAVALVLAASVALADRHPLPVDAAAAVQPAGGEPQPASPPAAEQSGPHPVLAAATALGVTAEPGAVVAPARADVGGYWLVDQRGHVHAFGRAPHLGEGPWGTVGLAAPPDASGYWLVTDRGVTVARGAVPELGAPPQLRSGERVVGIAATPTGQGAWLFTSRGAVHRRGDAGPVGDVGALSLNQPIIAGVPTPSGQGYWLVGADGGVFALGDARFRGSMGGVRLNAPVRGLVPTPSGQGYWLVAADGGVFAFGDAGFRGSMGGVRLNRPITAMVAGGDGYLMVASDGGVFTFGTGVPFHGSLGASPPPDAVVAVAPVAAGAGGSPGVLGDQPYRATVEPVEVARLTASWRPGCPVGPAALRLLTVDHWDREGLLRTGELVVHAEQAANVVAVFRELHAARFPVARMELVDRYGGDDDRSMAANNSSAFNCRRTTGGSAWSEHAYGRAIDINPVQNPYVRGSTVLPPAGRAHLDRSAATPGLIRSGDVVVRAFAAVGWPWGGHWSNPDYQHFSSTGR